MAGAIWTSRGSLAGRRRAVGVGMVLGLAACTAPGVDVATTEPDAAIYLDGRRVGVGSVATPFRYYGTSNFTVVPVRRAIREDVRIPVRASLEHAPPAPLWLVPLDFFVELYERGFAAPTNLTATIAPPPGEVSLVTGSTPPAAGTLRQHMERAEQER